MNKSYQRYLSQLFVSVADTFLVPHHLPRLRLCHCVQCTAGGHLAPICSKKVSFPFGSTSIIQSTLCCSHRRRYSYYSLCSRGSTKQLGTMVSIRRQLAINSKLVRFWRYSRRNDEASSNLVLCCRYSYLLGYSFKRTKCQNYSNLRVCYEIATNVLREKSKVNSNVKIIEYVFKFRNL